MLEGLKALKPSTAVDTSMPGIWGCQCTSLTSVCPACTKSSWGGRSSGASALPARAAGSGAAHVQALRDCDVCSHAVCLQPSSACSSSCNVSSKGWNVQACTALLVTAGL